MNASPKASIPSTPRRQFLKRSGAALAGTAMLSALSARSYAGENNTIKIALVGCGGRGTGAAANALSTQGPTKLWAMADVFQQRLDTRYQSLSKKFGKQVDVPPERRFLGFDGYKKAIDSLDPGDVVILATPPGFRPIHLEYAVEKGRNVFMEKSFAVDAPGVRRVLRSGEAAKSKNLKIAGGLNNRHYTPLEAAVAQLHQGLIGEMITIWAYREHGPVGFKPRQPGMSELLHQIQNYSCFTWLNGSFQLDWLIHNIDIACWIKQAWPVSAQGQGGRQLRIEPDQLFDHYAVEYTFSDGTRLFTQGRHMNKCWGFFGNVVHASKGSAVLGEGQVKPKIYKGYQPTSEKVIWKYDENKCDFAGSYQKEHDLLFAAIRADEPYNEVERCAKTAMTGILGRMAVESGQEITWDQAFASNLVLAPGLDNITLDSPAPVVPDAQGRYPIAMPGLTKVL